MVSYSYGRGFGTVPVMKRGDELLPIPVAAKELGMTRASLWRYVDTKRIPAEKMGRDWFIRREDLEAFNRERRPPGRPRKPPAP